ncbi:unnamed protein product [Rotaria sp. Silwood2]|nr:unnamed protein product [Rotaria sp. Silwood2]
MSNVKRPNTKTLLSYNFSSKKIRSDAENLTPSTNTPVAITIPTNDDASTLLSSSDLENSVQLNDEVNFSSSTVAAANFIRTYKDPSVSILSSNFIAFLKQLIDAGDEILRQHIERGPKDALYTSPLIQNEITDCIHKYILNEILHRAENCLLSIFVDETPDTYTAEQLSLSLRYYDKKINNIREDFLTFTETVLCTGETIANIILDYLTTHNLPYDNCVGQAYDGGSNMTGIYQGCQAFIKQKCPDAEYYHCSNHYLNLTLVNSCNKFRYGTLKDSTAESWYHAIINFQHIISTCISCFLLSEIIPTSRLLQTETLDFSSANRCVDDLLDTLDQRKQQAQDYVHNVIYSHADALRKELFVTPSIPSHSTLAMRKQNMSVCDPEMFYCDYVYLPCLDELVNNVKSRLSGLKGERIVLLSKLPPEVIINEKLFELTKHLLKQFASRLLSPLQ